MILPDPTATAAWGARLGRVILPGDAVTLAGPLGAGKTTLARGVLAGLGHHGDVPSPSFPLVVSYAPPETRLPLWHVDLYRIQGPDELDELGLDDARADTALLVEWPERLGTQAWPDALALVLEALPDARRRLTARVPAAWEERWQRL